MLNLIKRITNSLENSGKPFSYFVLTFLFAIMTRNFLEYFAYGCPVEYEVYLHFSLFWLSIVSSLILFYALATHCQIIKVAKIVWGLFPLVFIGPVFDLLFRRGINLSYLLPGQHDDLLHRFFIFFGNFSGDGITLGVKLELALILLLSLAWFYLKTNNIIKSLFNTLTAYIIFFAYCSVLFITNWLSNLFHLKITANQGFHHLYNCYLIITFIQICLWLYLDKRDLFWVIIKNARFLRLLHYGLMFILGLALGLQNSQILLPNLTDVFISSSIIICLSIIFAFIYSIITNDIEDFAIDEVSNKERPLVASGISLKTYRRLSWAFLFLALFYALVAGFVVFALIAVFIGNYFLYSMPPLRLKRVALLSKFVIGFNSLILLMLGFNTANGSFIYLPRGISLICLIGFSLAANFIDLKDYLGDKKAGIKTLPVILGLAKAKFLTGLFFILNYLSVALIFRLEDFYIRVIFCIFGLLQFYLINRKNYNERPIFYLHLSSLIALIVYFLFN